MPANPHLLRQVLNPLENVLVVKRHRNVIAAVNRPALEDDPRDQLCVGQVRGRATSSSRMAENARSSTSVIFSGRAIDQHIETYAWRTASRSRKAA